MGDVIAYVQANWTDIGVAILAVLGAASAIAKLTPTQADDAVVQKVYDLIHLIGLSKK
jgi:hypothetical protein